MTALDDVESFMFAYRELHLPGKVQTFSAFIRLYEEISQRDLWLERNEQRQRKDQILNSTAMGTITLGMMILEDFFYTCYSLSRDILRIPNTLAKYRKPSRVVRYLQKNLGRKVNTQVSKEFCLSLFHYVSKKDLEKPEYNFLSPQDKVLIMRQHEQNARALEHTLRIALRAYRTLSDAYNKYKHGFLFLFRNLDDSSQVPKLVQQLGPQILYFKDPEDPKEVTPVFVGPAVLEKLRTLIAGEGGVFKMLWDLTMNVTTVCKYAGRKIIAREYYGDLSMSAGEADRYKKLIEIFDRMFRESQAPKKLDLGIHSLIHRKDWEWFLEDWTLK